MSDKLLPLVSVILPVIIFGMIVTVSYYCGKASVNQEQTMDVLKERIDYWRLKNAMAVVGIEDIVETGEHKAEIKWVQPLDRGNR